MDGLTARDVMTSGVRAAREDWSLGRLAVFFAEHGISGAPVVSGRGALLGVVSATDLLRWRGAPEEEDAEARAPDYYVGDVHAPRLRLDPEAQPAGPTVRDVMTPTLFCVEEDTPVGEVAGKMIRGRLHRLLVTQKGRRRAVVGIVTALDLLRAIQDAAPPAEASAPHS